MVNLDVGVKAHEAEVQVAQREAPEFEKVNWKKEPHLRKLYAYAVVLMVASATTGYDGYAPPQLRPYLLVLWVAWSLLRSSISAYERRISPTHALLCLTNTRSLDSQLPHQHLAADRCVAALLPTMGRRR